MDIARVIKVIETTLTRRGSGREREDPIRIITQYWSVDGNLLAEVDPIAVEKRNVENGSDDASA